MIRSEESRRTGIEVKDHAAGVANVMISRNLHVFTIQLKKIAFVIVSMMSLSIVVRHPCETPV